MSDINNNLSYTWVIMEYHGTSTHQDSKTILFRKKERDFLLRFFGPPKSLPYPSLFIYGHSSSGKTLLLSELLKEFSLPHAWINGHETCTSQLLFASLVNQLSVSYDLDCSSPIDKQCNTLCDLVNFLKNSLKDAEETTYLIFDNAETLRHQSLVLATLLRIQELTKLNICTILISEIVWEKFRGTIGLFDPITLHLTDYTKEQLVDILCLDCPYDYSKDFYEGYASMILKVFFVVTRNLQELRHLAQLNFIKYCEPVVSGIVEQSNIHKLWRNIEPTLKEAIHAVYLREVSGPRWNMLLKENSDTVETSRFHMTKELPFYSKFLLLASYFASYNLPRTDHKHFVKNQGKQKKKRVTKKTEKNRHLLGPKAFTLDRMLSIFFSIVGDGVLPSALIFSQVSSLVSLQLIARVSMEDQLNSPKYKCLAELDLVRSIGRTVNIDVMSYLDDFI